MTRPCWEIAQRYGVTLTYAGQVARGKQRRDVPMPVVPNGRRPARRTPARRTPGRRTGAAGEWNGNAKFTWDEIDAMRRDYWRHMGEPALLAEEWNTSGANVWMICNNVRWQIPQAAFSEKYVRGSARQKRRAERGQRTP